MGLLHAIHSIASSMVGDINTASDTHVGTFWMTQAASTFAQDVDWLYDAILWLSVVSFVGIAGAVCYFLLRYKRRGDRPALCQKDHNLSLELTWTIIPTAMCAVIFYFGAVGYINSRTVPQDAYEIQVTAKKWDWTFTYPNGYQSQQLHVPLDRDVKLTMQSLDVLHSLYVPAFRAKMDVVPGRYSQMWFHPTQAGEHHLFCTEYCGTQHSGMITRVIVHKQPFEQWVDEELARTQQDTLAMSPAQRGEKLYKTKGCMGCHSVDGQAMVGPSFAQLWGKKRVFADGSTAVADANYIRRSIREPASQVVQGYGPVMPVFTDALLSDQDITAVAAYIKSLQKGKN